MEPGRSFLRKLSAGPGVYRMLAEDGTVLYVGKAKNLKRRVSSYYRKSGLTAKTMALMDQADKVEVTLTRTETEALILENNLIKHHRPRYNVLLRDDKSYPWIFVSTQHEFPRLVFHRGARRAKGRYFGPFPSTTAVRDSIQHLQKLFRLRNCEDHDFATRSRPCLQYQIERCTAPCVGYISAADYGRDVAHALMFLEGRNDEVVEALAERMEQAAAAQEYERASRFRDQIAHLRQAQERQGVSGAGGDLDVVAVRCQAGQAVAAVLFIRGGRVLGHRSYQPKASDGTTEEELAGAFLAQYYLGRECPARIVVSHDFPDRGLLEETLGDARGTRVRISTRVRGERKRWLDIARENADYALGLQLASDQAVRARLDALAKVLRLERPLQRIECFDASHTTGEATVVSCVVLDASGERRDQYRRFNVSDGGGDDYGALREALRRRYARLVKGEAPLPDLLLVDGGRAQLAVAVEVLSQLDVADVVIMAVAKGPARRAGQEQLFRPESPTPLSLQPDSPALHLVQQIRDEAHRFAIAGHRRRRAKARTQSVLESVDGLGPKRRQALLRHFGGLQQISRAGVDDLVTVRGIDRAIAQRIYDLFHGDDDT